MTDEPEDEQVQVNLRMPKSLRERIRRYAQTTDRSLNRAAVHAIRVGLDAEEGE